MYTIYKWSVQALYSQPSDQLGEPCGSAVTCWDSELEQVDKVLGWKGNGAALRVIGRARVVSALERNVMVLGLSSQKHLVGL